MKFLIRNMKSMPLEEDINEFLKRKNLKRLGILGKSSYGIVLSVKSADYKDAVAVKVSETKNSLECEVWPELLHPNIIPLYGIFATSTESIKAFLMPQCKVTLNQHLQSSLLIRQNDAFSSITKWLFQTLCGLKYLHERNLSHLDLKLDNILLTNKDNAVVSDFTHLSNIETITSTHFMGMPYYWKPPELWNCEATDKHVSQKLDAWCYGLVVLESITRFSLRQYMRTALDMLSSPHKYIPNFLNDALLVPGTLEGHMKKGFPSADIAHCVDSFRDLMQLLLQDSAKRISTKEAICHTALFPYNSQLIS